jgi:hypothetical protein
MLDYRSNRSGDVAAQGYGGCMFITVVAVIRDLIIITVGLMWIFGAL